MASSSAAGPRPQIACKHPSCGCLFQKKEFMRQHYADVHGSPAQTKKKGLELGQKQKGSVCERCGKSFQDVSSLAQHCLASHDLSQVLGELLISNGGQKEFQTGAKFVANSTPSEALIWPTEGVACNDCGKTFGNFDFLHQHQWDSADHTRVSRPCKPNSVTRECSQCSSKFPNSTALEQHFSAFHCLSEVPQEEEAQTWYQLYLRFRLGWKHPEKGFPVIHKIFKVYNMGWRRIRFEQYRKELKRSMVGHKDEENADMIQKVLANGNELMRFHGTRVKCELVGGSSRQLCSDGECNLCRILESGFKTSKCKVDYFQRFGRGIYVSATSSKANDYAKCSQGDGKKVLLPCRVLGGRVHRSVNNLMHLTSPPDGFHSVQGDPGPVLNYDEFVVYDDRAILPAYILLYSGL